MQTTSKGNYGDYSKVGIRNRGGSSIIYWAKKGYIGIVILVIIIILAYVMMPNTGLNSQTGDPGSKSSIQIKSGTGSFSGITSINKQIIVGKGSSISGSITMTTINGWASSATIILIGTPSWGNPQTSYWSFGSVVTSSTQIATTSLSAPSTSGTYYLIFIFSGEKNGAEVASLTNWAYGNPKWGDGNDVATFDSNQISEAQSTGRTIVNLLLQTGYELISMPCDAVTIVVQ